MATFWVIGPWFIDSTMNFILIIAIKYHGCIYFVKHEIYLNDILKKIYVINWSLDCCMIF